MGGSVASPTSQLFLQPFLGFTYVTAHYPTLPLLYLGHSSLPNPSVASPTSQLILEAFSRFTSVTTQSPTLPSLYLRHSSFFNPSVASSMSQLILQPFFRFSYVTSSSLTSPGEPPMIYSTLSTLQFDLIIWHAIDWSVFSVKDIYWNCLYVLTFIRNSIHFKLQDVMVKTVVDTRSSLGQARSCQLPGRSPTQIILQLHQIRKVNLTPK